MLKGRYAESRLSYEMLCLRCGNTATYIVLTERIPCSQFWKEREITVTSEERFSTVCQAERGDPGIVDDRAAHPRSLHETAQYLEKVVGLAEQTITW